MFIMPQQNSTPSASASVMDMINRMTQSSSPQQDVGFRAAGASTADPYINLLTQVAETQSIMAKTMDKAYGTFNKLIEFATSLFSGAGAEVMPRAITAEGMGVAEEAGSSDSWFDSAVKIGKQVWDFFDSGSGSDIIKGVKNFAGKAWDTVSDWAGGAWNSAKSIGGSIWDGAKSLGGSIWDGAKSLGSSVWDGVKSIGSTVGGWLGSIF